MLDVLTYVNDLGGSIEFSLASGFILTRDTYGLTENHIIVTTSKGVGQKGETLQSANVEPRPITIAGFIQGLATAGKQRLLDVVLPEVPAKLYHNGEYYLSVTPTQTPTIEAADYFARFQFALTAPYPYWIAANSKSSAIFELLPKFKFPINLTKPYRFAEGTETAFVNVKNIGQLETPYKAVFRATGEVVNPRIENINTKEFLLLNKTLQRGEVVTVEFTHDLTYVTSSIDGDIRGDLDIDSDLFRLKPGDNFLKPDADKNKGAMSVSVEYSYEKAGVVIR
ncbi:MAG: phage tail family protein [Clostridia bacterium]|nr:phage tail family protein [Clostridia bacterium]